MGKPLLEVLRDVALDPAEQAAFTNDPSAYLAQYGFEDVPADDISEAFGLVADTLPPDMAQTVADAAPAAPTAPVDDLAPDGLGELGDPADAGADGFGEVTNDFDAFAAGADGLDPDDGFDADDGLDGEADTAADEGADFGTGEVAAVVDDGAYDDGAFGEGSEAAGLPGGYDSPLDADDLGLDDVGGPGDDPGGYDDTPLDPDGITLEDGLDDGLPDDHPGGYDDSPGDPDDIEIPDDPGDFLDDIGSF